MINHIFYSYIYHYIILFIIHSRFALSLSLSLSWDSISSFAHICILVYETIVSLVAKSNTKIFKY